MCQMCDEYEATLIRMGLIEEAKHVRAERHGEKRSDSERRTESRGAHAHEEFPNRDDEARNA